MATKETWRPRLVVSDLDGTLINSYERVTDRLQRAIAQLSPEMTFILATGRPMRWVQPIVAQLPIQPLCLCGNGAVVYDSANDRVLQADPLSPEAIASVIRVAQEHVDDVSFAVERAGSSALDTSKGALFAVTAAYPHAWDSDEHRIETPAEMASRGAIKLLIRSPLLSSQRLYELVAPHIASDLAHVTFSMPDGLLEVSRPGVNKGAALRQLAPSLGYEASETIAFGDMPNDIEMLQWAHYGVAMATAPEEVRAVANEVTASHDADGVALVLERFCS